MILFRQTLREVKSMFKGIGGYDMADCELKKKCRNAWSEKFKYLCFDMTENKIEGKYQTFNGSNNTYNECIPESEAFSFLNVASNEKTEMI